MKKTVEKNIEDIIALTPTQEGMLFHYLKNPGGTQYSEQLCLNISGEIDIRWFEKAWDVVTKTNEMLRTQFRWEKLEKPAQIILKEHKCDLHIYDLTDNNNRQSQAALEEIKTRDRQKTLDLTRVPFRVSLCRIAGNKYRLIISNHHILYDGWSTGIILREFFNAYHALSSGNQPVNPLAKPSFKEFIRWRQSQDKTNQERFWKEYLTGFDNPTALPIKKRRKEPGEIKGSGRCTVSLPGSIKNRLEIFLKQHRATMASFFYSTWGILLQRYCNTDEVIFGTTVSGRSAPIKSLQDMVGLFINTIPLRIRTGVGENIKDLLCRVNDSLSIRENYESTPLVDIKEYSQVASQVDLFDSLVVMENYPLDQSLMKKYSRLPLVVDSYSIVESTHYDLCISITIGEVIGINFIYNPLSLEESSISGLSSHFNNIIEYILINPGNEIFQIEMLPAEEKKQVLYDFNDTETAYPQDKTIHGIFAEQAEKTPDHIALLCSEGTRGLAPLRLAPLQLAPLLTPISITYRELNEKSYQLAQKLKAKGVTADTIVGLMLERSPEMIISIMGILKAGGAYLPLDPEYPEQRIISMLEHSRSSLILTQNSIMEEKPMPSGGVSPEVVYIEEMEELIGKSAGLPGEDLEPGSGPGNLIYIIFTSGSTGIPKGAGVYHRGFVNLLHWFVTEFELNPQDRNLLLTSLSFDLTQKNLYASLITGGTLCVPGVGYFDPHSLVKQTREQGVTWINCTPSMFYQIVEYDEAYHYKGLSGLRWIFLGGEPIAMAFLLPWLESGTCRAEIVNTYGPTECTDICNFYRVRQPGRFVKEEVPLGKPVYNVQLYIVDRHLQLTPVGVAGELTIGGAGVGKGYINDKELTARKFITHSFDPGQPPQLLYKTGDLVKWLPDGNMVFLGRIDHQVKVRGFRIELGEIEKRLLDHDAVKEAVAVVREEKNHEKNLCAYIVLHPGASLQTAKLLEYLSRELPGYMVPAYVVQLEKMPLNPNGKVDRKSLPEPERTTQKHIIHPQNKTQNRLAAIWARVLELDKTCISIDDNFFNLGGHSLKATTLVSHIYKELNVEIPLPEVFTAPTIRDLALYIDHREQSFYTRIEPAERKEYYTLSSVQKRLYALWQLEASSIVYNISLAFLLEGHPGKHKLEIIFKELVRRHESLRTSFEVVDIEPVQRIHEEVKFEIENKEFSSPLEIETVIREFLRPFDLSQAPLLRVGLIKLHHTPAVLRRHPRKTNYNSQQEREDKYLLMVDMHHIISDGISSSILVKEFMALAGEEKLPELKLQYKDYANWQNNEKQKGILAKPESYWKKQFEDDPPVLDLPTDFTRPAVQSFAGRQITFEIGEEEVKALKSLALAQGTTLYVVLLALYNVFLFKLSNQEDIVLGTPIAGRAHADLEPIIGMFVNTLVLRNYPRGDRSLLAFLTEVKERTLEAFDHQDYQYEDLVNQVIFTRDSSRNPLFDTMFVLQNTGIPALEIPGLKMIPFEHHIETSKFDLTLIGVEEGQRLKLIMEYSTRLFKPVSIRRFLDYFKRVVSTAAGNPAVKLSDLEIISVEEKHRILYDFNDTRAEYPENKTLHELFAEQVQRTPDRIALVCSEGTRGLAPLLSTPISITYRELNEKSHQLALRLREKGVEPDTIVGIMMERSIEMIIGLLGILKAGGAYLPIDPQYPEERITYMLKDSNAQVLVVNDTSYSSRLSLAPKALLNLSEGHHLNFPASQLPSFPASLPSSLAYIIYTSGSTGNPKGVLVEHSSVVNLAYSQKVLFNINENDRVLQFSTICFDASVEQIFITLLSGAILVLIHKNTLLDPHGFDEFMTRHSITHIHAVPSFLSNMKLTAASISTLKRVIAGGDICPVELARTWNRYCDFYNKYGPTETTVTSIEMQVKTVDEGLTRLPIGKPLNNTTAYLLDRWMKVVPLGSVGELYLGGKGVTRGYLNRPELTSEKFYLQLPGSLFEKTAPGPGKNFLLNTSQYPNTPIPHSPIYMTGDLARWLPDGNMEFLGRMDHQVKIRGFRVELGEIENCLLTHNKIKKAVVLAKREGDGPGNQCLVAYFIADRDVSPTITEIREHLQAFLPEYMIPHYFIHVDKIPLTASGKIDRQGLPEPGIRTGKTYTPPRDEIEKKLVKIWIEVLAIPPQEPGHPLLGIDDNFFELGGHSLKAIKLISRIRKELHAHITLAEIFKKPTIMGLSGYIREKEKDLCGVIEPAEKKEYYVLSSAQKRLVILQQLDVNSTVYNIPVILLLEGIVEKDKWEDIFFNLIKRHESLRTSFVSTGEMPVQQVHDEVEFTIWHYNLAPEGTGGLAPLSNGAAARSSQQVEAFISSFIRPFDLSRAPLLRVGIMKLQPTPAALRSHPSREGTSILMVDMHHIISDGISSSILVKEFMALAEGEKLPELKLQYKDYAEWQNNEKQKGILAKKESYWKKQFEDDPPVLDLPADYTRPAVQSFAGSQITFEIDEEEVKALKSLALAQGTTLYVVLLTLYNIFLSKLSNQEDIVLGTPTAGRGHADLEPIIGMFVNTLVLRNYPHSDQSFLTFLTEVKERALEAFDHQDYQYEDLVNQVLDRRDSSRNPLFDTMFVLQNTGIPALEIPGLKMIPIEHHTETSKFDLTLIGVEENQRLKLIMEYSTRLFKSINIRRFLDYFKRVVSTAAGNPAVKLSDLEILSGEEKHRILYDFNDTRAEYPENKTLHELFAEQAQRTPDRIALVGEEEGKKGRRVEGKQEKVSLTYKKLNENANQLAQLLRSQGVKRETITAIMMSPGLGMIIGILAVLKANSAYLPIDPQQHAGRIAFMLKDSNAGVLVTTPKLQVKVKAEVEEGSGQPQGLSLQIINIDKDILYFSGSAPLTLTSTSTCQVNPANLAYIIYTSGTTGKSKGTLVMHKSLVNYVYWFRQKVHLTGRDRAVLTSSYSFDLGYTAIYPSILTGCQLHMIPRETYMAPEDLISYLHLHGITYIKVTPSLFTTIVENPGFSPTACPGLRLVVLGGEGIKLKDVEKAHRTAGHLQFMNHYGPTEATIGCVAQFIDFSGFSEYQEKPTIGHPIHNMKVTILDNQLKLVPVGVPGELCVSGAGVARGYLNQPELTAQKFRLRRPGGRFLKKLPPWTPGKNFSPHSTIYQTGDRARWWSDASIEFLGRIDTQVKIRGYRIETGEIENRLLTHEAINEAAVIPREHPSLDKYLCAYIVLKNPGSINISALKEYLAAELPEYMIPSFFVLLDHIPLTPNGKLNRKLLPAPQIGEETGYEGPRDAMEAKLIGIWADMLGPGMGINDNFFHRGGNSLTAVLLISRIHKEFHVRVPLAVIFKSPTIKGLSRYLRSQEKSFYSPVRPVEKQDYYAMSSVQKRLNIVHRLDKTGIGYNMPVVIGLEGEVDRRKLEEVFLKLIHRHESLRTSFQMMNDETVQHIHDEVEFEIENKEVVAKAEEEQPPHFEGTRGLAPLSVPAVRSSQPAAALISSFIRPFDLSQAPLLRVGFIKLLHPPTAPGGSPSQEEKQGKKDRYLLIVDMHHIISDGISRQLLVQEFTALMADKDLPPLKLQYKDYAEWQNIKNRKAILAKQESYWKKQFEDDPPMLDLPTDYTRPTVQSFAGSKITFKIGEEEVKALKSLALAQGTTLYVVLLALYNIFLSKLSNQEDIVVGTPTAGRGHADLEPIIGMFVNTLVLRNYPRGDRSFLAFLTEVKERTLEAFDHQDYQYEDLVNRVLDRRDRSRNPLFDTMFVLQNTGIPALEIPGLKMIPFEHHIETSKFDLTLIGVEEDQRLKLTMEYSTRLFKPVSIRRFLDYFKRVVSTAAGNPGVKLSDIEIISGEEKHRILYDFNDTRAEYPVNKTIHELFAEQVQRTPDRIAMVGKEEGGKGRKVEGKKAEVSFGRIFDAFSVAHLSYKELNIKANQLAHLLKERGVKPDTVVGLMLERSLEMITGILGILKAGGGYLPIDPEYPEQRIISMLEHSRSSLILTRGSIMEKKPLPPGGLALGVVGIEEMEELIKEPASLPAEDMEPSSGPGNLIYVIFTSGSTGIPKGAGVYHRGFVNLLHWFVTEFALNPQDRNLLLTSLSFDLTQKNLYASLITGGTLCVPGVGYFDPRSLVKQTREQEVTWINCTPSMFYQIVEYEETYNYEGLSSLRCVFLGGEPIAMSFLLPWLESGTCRAEIVNTYGPTECTDICNFYRVKEPRRFLKEPVPLGKPVYNVRLYIVDRHLQLTPVGVAGELTIAGAGVGKGYINDKDLTARKFTTHSFTPAHPPQLLYKTGDLVKWQPDGNMVFLGRIDHQVKVRGFRIEIGEIERWLSAYENVSEAVVLSREDGAGSNYLCGYVVLTPGGKLDSKALKTYLSQALPNYMIPSFFVQLEKIPLTANGKVDRKALPVPTVSPGRDYAPPQNEIEVTLAGIWSELLGLDKGTVGIHDDFFQLGGHSLKAAVLAAKIHKALNVKIPLADIFKSPTIRDLSQYINAKEKEQYISIEAAEQKEYYPLSSVQKRLYLLYQADRNSTAYNMPGIMILFGKTDRGKLEDTFKQLIVRHENFHTSFRQIKGEPVQLVHDHVELETTDYTDYKDEKKDTKNKEGQSEVFGSTFFQKGGPPEAVIKNFIRPFDLSRAPLLRVSLEPLETGKYLLMTDMHHIVSDGLSMGIMVREFMALLDGEKLPPLALQYKDFSEWWNRERKKENIRQQEAFWVKSLAGNPPVLRLPYDHPRPGERDYEGDVVEFTLDQEQTAALNHLAKEEGVTLFMLLLALFYVFLARLSGQEDILVGTPTVGRHQEELNRTMGMFVNTLVLRNFPQGSRTFKEFLQKLKERTLNAFANQDYPFEEVVELVASHWDKTRNPLFDVMFALQNLDIPAISIPGLTLEPYPYEHHISKFDLDLVGIENNGILAFTMEYRTALFKKSTIQRFIDYFKDITRVVLENKTVQLNNIEIKVFLEVAETSAAELTEAREAFEF